MTLKILAVGDSHIGVWKLVRKSIHLYLKLANSYSGGGKITTICDDIDAALVNKEKLKLLKSKLK